MQNLESVVILKYPDWLDKRGGLVSGGYTATIRFKDSSLDKILSSYTKENLPNGFGIYQQVETYVRRVLG